MRVVQLGGSAMFEIWKLMDAIHGKSLRPFIILVLASCGLNVLAYGVQMLMPYNTMGLPMIHLGLPFYATIVISFITLLVLHLRFQMRFVKGGGLTRMQLLPMHRTTYLWEEALFIFLTICMLLVGVYVSIISIYLLNGTVMGQANDGFMYLILNNGFLVNGILPIEMDRIIMLVVSLFALSMCYLVFVQSVGNGMLLVENMILLIVILIVSIMFINTAIERSFADLTIYANGITMMVVGIALFIRMQFAFRSGKIGG